MGITEAVNLLGWWWIHQRMESNKRASFCCCVPLVCRAELWNLRLMAQKNILSYFSKPAEAKSPATKSSYFSSPKEASSPAKAKTTPKKRPEVSSKLTTPEKPPKAQRVSPLPPLAPAHSPSPTTKKKPAVLTASFPSSSSAKAGSNSLPSRDKLTPLQQQWFDVKATQSPDAILMVECGYKYRFFGSDAEIAAKELGVFMNWDHGVQTCSIPTFRLHFHLSRLVNAGYKVGIVAQTETAALKAVGSNKSQPFTRSLKGLYTKATIVDLEHFASDESTAMYDARFLMCLVEEPASADSSLPRLGAIAVQPSTGQVLYEQWTDEPLRPTLESFLRQVAPCEILLGAGLLTTSESLITRLAAETTARIEHAVAVDQTQARERARAFLHNEDDMGRADTFFESLPPAVVSCLALLIPHLQGYNLERILCVTSNWQSLRYRNAMQLPGSTLQHLDIFSTRTGTAAKGSLWHLMDRTSTPFGRRLLHHWMASPLLLEEDINDRLDAVTELMHAHDESKALLTVLLHVPDLERSVTRAFLGRISPREFIGMIECVQRVAGVAAKVSFKSAILQRVLEELSDSSLSAYIAALMADLSVAAARENNKENLFVSETRFPQVDALKKRIQSLGVHMDELLIAIRKQVSMPALDYVTKQGQGEYMIELPVGKKVPAEWTKIAGTQKCNRFHPPEVTKELTTLAQLREALQLETTKCWAEFLSAFAEQCDVFRKFVQALAELDCLASLARVSAQTDYCRPIITPRSSSQIVIREGRNPIVENLLNENGEPFVANNTALSHQEGNFALLITGPNMGGKSCYIRQVALITIMAQLGCYVPAASALLSPVDGVFTRMGASDNLEAGKSTFFVELQETCFILKHATEHSLLILDELGRGTSTHDGTAVAFATLDFLIRKIRGFVLFVTHYPILGQLQEIHPTDLACVHMSFKKQQQQLAEQQSDSTTPQVTFLYKLTPGIAPSSFGFHVARLAGVPAEIVERAAAKADQMKASERAALRRHHLQAIRTANSAAELVMLIGKVK